MAAHDRLSDAQINALNRLASLAYIDKPYYEARLRELFPNGIPKEVSRPMYTATPELMAQALRSYGLSVITTAEPNPPPLPYVAVAVAPHEPPPPKVLDTVRIRVLQCASRLKERGFYMMEVLGDKSSVIRMKPSDKVVGAILVIAAIGALGYGLYWVLPFLIEMAANTIFFVGELIALVLLVLVFGDKSTWVSIYLKWKNISRNIRKAIIREDPIGVFNTVIARFAKKLEEIGELLTVALGAQKRQRNAIQAAKDKSKEELELAQAAQRLGKPEVQIKQHIVSAERWAQTAERLEPSAALLAKAREGMERARDLCSARMADMESQRDAKKLELDAMTSAQGVIKRFKGFFGNNADLELEDMVLEEIERQSTEAEAEIDEFLRAMEPAIATADLKKEASVLSAMDRFQHYIDTGKPFVPELPAAQPQPAALPAAQIKKESKS